MLVIDEEQVSFIREVSENLTSVRFQEELKKVKENSAVFVLF
jgi:hypothetical protein